MCDSVILTPTACTHIINYGLLKHNQTFKIQNGDTHNVCRRKDVERRFPAQGQRTTYLGARTKNDVSWHEYEERCTLTELSFNAVG